ncbi:hypothetical protein [Hymenobacter sp. NBH84]|uniref:plasmid mobilization protein n=1 Tax=Hymenobacter sp. NBH84 TaxID=2596915 RepID=UPI0035BC40C7
MEQAIVPTTGADTEEEAVKDRHINVRISAADKRIIEEKAKKAGLKTGDFMRRARPGAQHHRESAERIAPPNSHCWEQYQPACTPRKRG